MTHTQRRIALMYRAIRIGNRGQVPAWLENLYEDTCRKPKQERSCISEDDTVDDSSARKVAIEDSYQNNETSTRKDRKKEMEKFSLILKNLLAIHRETAFKHPEVFLRELLTATIKEQYWEDASSIPKSVKNRIRKLIELICKHLHPNELALILSYGIYPPPNCDKQTARACDPVVVKQRAQDVVMHYYEYSQHKLLKCLRDVSYWKWLQAIIGDEWNSRVGIIFLSFSSLIVAIIAILVSFITR